MFISRYVDLHIPTSGISEPHLSEGKMPSPVQLSLILYLVLVEAENRTARFVRRLYCFSGSSYQHPFTAILVACLVAIYGLAMRRVCPKTK